MYPSRLQPINHLLLNDSLRNCIVSANRVLAFEQYLDKIEITKGKHGSMPKIIEERALKAFNKAQDDVQDMVRSVLELFNEFNETSHLDNVVPSLADRLEQSGELDFGSLWLSAVPSLEKFMIDQGLNIELWHWAMQYVSFDEIFLSGQEGQVKGRRKDRSTILVSDNPNHIPLVDINAFVNQKFYRHFASDPNAVIDSTPQHNPYAGVLILTKGLLEEYEERVRTTALKGVQVLPTGVAWFVIIVIVLIIIAATAAVVYAMCEDGVISPGMVCDISLPVLGASLFVLCLMLGGKAEPITAGAVCTLGLIGGAAGSESDIPVG